MVFSGEQLSGTLSLISELEALPTLYAAASADARGGDYIGPDGFAESSGHPTKIGCNASARDQDVAARLWEVSERLTGVRYAPLAPRQADGIPVGAGRGQRL